MPTYDYECTKCGDQFCAEQSMTDEPLKKCKKCGGKLQKLLPKSLNLIFKGSGFYVTDYRKGKGPTKPKEKAVGSDTESS
jgi:putative FmdB family regulatory protein